MATGCLEGKIREFAGRRLWHGSCNAWARNRSFERVLVKKGRPMNQEKGGTEKEQATPTPESGRARILVGFDALEESNEPLEQALSFTQMMSVASIDIAWVPPPRMFSLYGAPPPDNATTFRERVEDFLRNRDPELPIDARTEFTLLLRHGAPADELSKLALERRSHVIIVGAHQEQGLLSEFLMGSVSRRLVEKAPCPVLVVRPQSVQATPDFEEPSQRGQASRSSEIRSYPQDTQGASDENVPFHFPTNS